MMTRVAALDLAEHMVGWIEYYLQDIDRALAMNDAAMLRDAYGTLRRAVPCLGEWWVAGVEGTITRYTGCYPVIAHRMENRTAESAESAERKRTMAECRSGLTTEELLRELILTREHVAALLHVSEETVNHLHETHQLPAVRVGEEIRWRPGAVVAYVPGLVEDVH